jgi:hypothetical protein
MKSSPKRQASRRTDGLYENDKTSTKKHQVQISDFMKTSTLANRKRIDLAKKNQSKQQQEIKAVIEEEEVLEIGRSEDSSEESVSSEDSLQSSDSKDRNESSDSKIIEGKDDRKNGKNGLMNVTSNTGKVLRNNRGDYFHDEETSEEEESNKQESEIRSQFLDQLELEESNWKNNDDEDGWKELEDMEQDIGEGSGESNSKSGSTERSDNSNPKNDQEEKNNSIFTAGKYEKHTINNKDRLKPKSTLHKATSNKKEKKSQLKNRPEGELNKETNNNEKMDSNLKRKGQPTPNHRDKDKAERSDEEIPYYNQQTHKKYLVPSQGIDDSDEKKSESGEDDCNTINSNETTHNMRKEEADKQKAPKTVRYQLILNVPDIADKLFEEIIEENKEGTKDENPEDMKERNLIRLSKMLMGLYQTILKADEGALIVSWEGKSKNFTTISNDQKEFPNTITNLRKYFDGFRNLLQGKLYLKFRVHAATIGEKQLAQKMLAWAETRDHILQKCLIQSATVAEIGWLVYSSEYTHKAHLASFMKRETNFEWGFKTQAITKGDKEGKKWHERNRAVSVLVPAEKAEVAAAIISRIFTNSVSTKKDPSLPSFTDRYIFVPSEAEVTAIPDEQTMLWYKEYLDKQKTHTECIQAKVSLNIVTDIDVKFFTEKKGYISLREMILDIKSQREDTKGVRLFHSIDFCEDTSKTFFGNQRGAGGPGHIFSFYKLMTSEALGMVKGLGIYLSKVYGANYIRDKFRYEHWEINKGWKWSNERECFETPEAKHLQDNLDNDPNAKIIKMMSKLEPFKETGKTEEEIVEQLRKAAEARNKVSTDEEEFTRAEEQQANSEEQLQREREEILAATLEKAANLEFIKRVNDKDMDSQNSRPEVKGPAVKHVHFSADVTEVSRMTAKTNQTGNSEASLKSFNPEFIQSLREKGFSEEDLIQEAHKNYQRALKRIMQTAQTQSQETKLHNKPSEEKTSRRVQEPSINSTETIDKNQQSPLITPEKRNTKKQSDLNEDKEEPTSSYNTGDNK